MAEPIEKKTVLTKEGYKKLEAELDYYISVRRNEIADQIAVARGFGDRHDGGVHARRISAGSQNTNTTHKRIRLLIKWMEKRAHARKSARHASETRWQN